MKFRFSYPCLWRNVTSKNRCSWSLLRLCLYYGRED